MDKEAMRLLKRLMYDAYHAELIEEAKEAVKKEVSKSVKESECEQEVCAEGGHEERQGRLRESSGVFGLADQLYVA